MGPPSPAPTAAPTELELASARTVRRPPAGAPAVRVNVLQWSPDPARRFVYVSVVGEPAMTQVREGEDYQGMKVKRIYPAQVEFLHGGESFVLAAN